MRTMKEIMDQELASVEAKLDRANSALSRVLKIRGEESEIGEWEERTSLTHAEQVDWFGWCVCEGTQGEGHISADCPEGESE